MSPALRNLVQLLARRAYERRGIERPALDYYRGLPRLDAPKEYRGRGTWHELNSTAIAQGVYLLWSGPRLLYVGRSVNVAARLRHHFLNWHSDPRLYPTHATWIAIKSIAETATVEADLIARLRPMHNRRMELVRYFRPATRKP